MKKANSGNDKRLKRKHQKKDNSEQETFKTSICLKGQI